MQHVDAYPRVSRPHACHASDPLLHPRDGPGHIEMNNDTRVLEVYSFAENIRRKQEIDDFSWMWRTGMIGHGSETPDRVGASERATSDSGTVRGQHRDPSRGGEASEQR